MPPKTPENPDTQPSRATLRQRWKSAGGVLRGAVTWAVEHPWRAGLVIGACLLSVSAVVFGWIVITAQYQVGESVTLETVLETLDSGAYTEARDLAKKLIEQDSLPLDELGGPAFARGAASAYEADNTWSNDKITYYLLAARYLEDSRDRGFPPGREAEGLYLLGRSLYLSGQIPSSRPFLLSALKLNKDKATEIHRLLAGAYLHDANPKLEEALKENTLYLADRKLPRTIRHDGLLQRAQILLGMERINECMATLEKIPSDAKNRADAVILRGRVLMHEAQMLKNRPDLAAEDQQQAQRKYRAAIKTLQLAQGRDTLSTQATRKAMYLIGRCYLEIEDYRTGLAQFARTRKLHPDTPEALVASFQEGELSRQLGRNEDALAAYRRTLAAVTDPENFSNPWITLDELRSGILTAYQDYLNSQNFEISLQLTKFLYPLFSRVRTLELAAQAHHSWGNALLVQAAHLPHSKAEPLKRKGRAQLRQAGLVHARLAKLQLTSRKYPEQLWKSASAYFQGQDYSDTVEVLQEYLKNESRWQHPQSLVLLGNAWLGLGQLDKALEVFQECIEFHPRDVAACRARLSAGKVYLEKGDPQKVEQLLQENLNGEVLDPRSNEWRESLFALAELLHEEHRYKEGIAILEEAVLRYPLDPKAMQARYRLADAHRQSAKAAYDKLKANLSGTGQVLHTKEIRESYQKALEGYQEVERMLNERQEVAELTPREKATLRNCHFMIGGVLLDLGQYEAAIKAYRNVTNRYQNQPEVLLAYTQIVNAYRQLNRLDEVEAVLKRAKMTLGRMKTEAEFEETTNYSRQQWSDLLDSLSAL